MRAMSDASDRDGDGSDDRAGAEPIVDANEEGAPERAEHGEGAHDEGARDGDAGGEGAGVRPGDATAECIGLKVAWPGMSELSTRTPGARP